MLGDNPYAEATQLIMTFMREGPATESATSKLLTANNMTVPKEIFLDMGGFERGLRYGEDRYFCHRWRLAGRPIVVDPDALVFHEHDLGLCDFWKLHVQYGSGSAAARRFLAQRENVPYRLEPWRTYWHLLAFPFKVNNGFRAWSTAGLVLAAQLATAEGTIQDRVRHRGRKDGVF
jgi:GT2 family glycosyltransferase